MFLTEKTLAKYDDDYLLSGLNQSDPIVFRIVYNLYWRKLYNIAYYYARTEQDAEDIVQDVFISLWAARERLKLKGPLENYLVRSVKYTSFFYLKTKQIKKRALEYRPVSDSGQDTEEYMSYRDLQRSLATFLETLSQKTRNIFLLSRFDGLSYREIAEQQHVSVKTVEYHISLVLKKLSSAGI